VAEEGSAGGPKKATRSEHLKWVLQTLAMPIALVTLPLLYQWKAADLDRENRAESRRREQAEQQFRLYTDLMSKREESDTAVRRGLFDKLMGTYLAPNPGDVGKRLVALELLSLNFHDSLNLSPLFWELATDITQSPAGKKRDEFSDQLDRVAAQVKQRQASLLEVDGKRQDFDVDLNHRFDGNDAPSFHVKAPRVHDDANVADPEWREFDVAVVAHDPAHRRLKLTIASPGMKTLAFWVDPYDFPLVNFSRVSRNERIAVVLHRYNNRPEFMSASLVFLYFPSWRSGAKDKPYLDDLLAKLARPPVAVAAAAPASAAASDVPR
jgi:hypothetical protein